MNVAKVIIKFKTINLLLQLDATKSRKKYIFVQKLLQLYDIK